jgi:hypothetical protein
MIVGFSKVFGQDVRRRIKRPLTTQERVLPVLTPEDEAFALEYLQESEPQKAFNLLSIRESNPAYYRKLISRYAYEIKALNRLKETDPEKYDRLISEKRMDRESRMIAKKYRSTEDVEEKAQIKNNLESLLNKIFDERQLNRRDEIGRLEKRLTELKKINQERLVNKEKIINLRIEKLLGENRSLEW